MNEKGPQVLSHIEQRRNVAAALRAETLDSASRCVLKDRNQAHGDPEDNFSMIAQLWTAFLSYPVNATQVAAMMALMKIARLKHNPTHEDSWVDLAGYAACGAGIALADKRMNASYQEGSKSRKRKRGFSTPH